MWCPLVAYMRAFCNSFLHKNHISTNPQKFSPLKVFCYIFGIPKSYSYMYIYIYVYVPLQFITVTFQGYIDQPLHVVTLYQQHSSQPPSPRLSSPQPISFPGDVEIAQVSLHPEGKHVLALSQNREVYSWGTGENGQLGLGDIK